MNATITISGSAQLHKSGLFANIEESVTDEVVISLESISVEGETATAIALFQGEKISGRRTYKFSVNGNKPITELAFDRIKEVEGI